MIILTQRLHFVSSREWRAYAIAVLFIIGNIVFPQLCHLIPNGGSIFLPIYFFTLIGAYRYGWKIGLFIAILSPLANHLLFGMPGIDALPFIGIKSVLLSLIAGYASWRFARTTLLTIACIVVSYQGLGFLAEWFLTNTNIFAMQEVIESLPGMLIQTIVGFAIIRYVLKR